MKEYAEKRFEVKKTALNIASVTLLLLFVFSKDLSGERGWLALSEHFLKFFQVPALSWTRHLTIKCSYFFKQLLIFIFSDAFMQSILQSEKKRFIASNANFTVFDFVFFVVYSICEHLLQNW